MRTHDGPPGVWRKSSRSFAGNECVEVATADSRVWLRDSKLAADAPVLRSNADAWRGFIAGVKSQRFDH